MAKVKILVNGSPMEVEETTPGLFGQLGYKYATATPAVAQQPVLKVGVQQPPVTAPLSVDQQVAQAKAMLAQTQAEGNKPFAGSSYQQALNTTPTTPTVTNTTVLPDDQLAALKKAYADALAQNEKTAALSITNNPENILNAYLTGDWSGVTDAMGQPFSLADQQDALAKSQAALAPYYEAEQKKATADVESQLAQQQSEYQNYLDTQAQNFQKEKTTLDQTAADQGVLFSGGRAQKEQQLQSTYDKDLAYKQSVAGTNIANAARDYQYKFGDTAAGGLSKYYSLGGQNYNPNVATGGVTSGGLSSIYNSAGLGYQGTQKNTALAEAQKRAAGLLTNKANKLVASGYKNQL